MGETEMGCIRELQGMVQNLSKRMTRMEQQIQSVPCRHGIDMGSDCEKCGRDHSQ